MKTKLTEMFGIEYPIVQSGMQWLAVPQLAAAVIPILPGLQHRFIQMHHRHHRAGGVAPHIILVVPLGPLPLPDAQPDQHHTGQKKYDPPHNVSHIHPFLPYAVWRTL